jgi:glycosyltransferase involved in cell wall biosynthesis
MNPEVSIVIPCYNHGKYIREALLSVQKSTYIKNCEIIIVNDGSNDSFTIQVLSEIEEEGIFVINQPNQGLGKTRNNGIKVAKGKYILPLDADNKISPSFIEKALVAFNKDNSISIIYTDREFFGTKQGVEHVGKFDTKRMINMNYIDACAIFRKEAWQTIGGYDENMPIMGWEDWDFWLSAIENKLLFYYIPEPLFQYRVIEDSMLHRLHKDVMFTELLKYICQKHSYLMYQVYNDIYKDYEISIFEKKHLLRTSIKYFYKWIFNKQT